MIIELKKDAFHFYQSGLTIDFFDENPYAHTLVYIIEDRIVGYLSYLKIYEKIEIAQIEVEEEYRRSHIASSLLDKLLILEAQEENITLEVREDNKEAIALYYKYHFQEVARRKNYYNRKDGILMELKIKKSVFTLGVPIKDGCNVEGADLGIEELKDHIPFDHIISVSHEKEEMIDNMKHLKSIAKTVEEVADVVDRAIKDGYLPITVGGDHSLAIGTIAGSAANGEIGVLWVDSHGDINNQDTTLSGNIHGFPLSVSFGVGPSVLTSCHGNKKKVKKENVVIFGYTDLDESEYRIIDELKLKAVSYQEIKERGLSICLKEVIDALKKKVSQIHLSFDIDSMDPNVICGVSVPTRARTGFTHEDAVFIIRYVLDHIKVQSIDLVEYNPVNDKDEITKKEMIQLYELMLEKLKGRE